MKTLAESEIIYRDFWDLPRIFIVRHDDQHYLFDCRLSESNNDYEETYGVYTLTDLSSDALDGSWDNIHERAASHLGVVLVKDVVFDPSRRRSIDTAVIDTLLDSSSAASRKAHPPPQLSGLGSAGGPGGSSSMPV